VSKNQAKAHLGIENTIIIEKKKVVICSYKRLIAFDIHKYHNNRDSSSILKLTYGFQLYI
jgi:hypothetical protein